MHFIDWFMLVFLFDMIFRKRQRSGTCHLTKVIRVSFKPDRFDSVCEPGGIALKKPVRLVD